MASQVTLKTPLIQAPKLKSQGVNKLLLAIIIIGVLGELAVLTGFIGTQFHLNDDIVMSFYRYGIIGFAVGAIGLASFALKNGKRDDAQEVAPKPNFKESSAKKRSAELVKQTEEVAPRRNKLVYPNETYSTKKSAAEKLKKQTAEAGKSSNYLKEGVKKAKGGHFISPTASLKFEIRAIPSTCKSQPNRMAEYQSKDEDRHLVCTTLINGKQVKIFGVFDGHGDGGYAGDYIALKLPGKLEAELQGKELNDDTITNAITKIFIDLHNEYRLTRLGGGATATCTIDFGDAIYTPNVGDSRAILVSKHCRKVTQLSEDAVLESERFSQYHLREGHRLIDDHGTLRIHLPGMHRGQGVNMARDIGLLQPKPKISKIVKGSDYQQGDYIVIGSDGLWKVANNEEIRNAIVVMKDKGLTEQEMSEQILYAALLRGQFKHNGEVRIHDDITVQVIKL